MKFIFIHRKSPQERIEAYKDEVARNKEVEQYMYRDALGMYSPIWHLNDMFWLTIELFWKIGIFILLLFFGLWIFSTTLFDNYEIIPKAHAADTGWLDADTFTSAGTGVAFTNPSNAISSNNAYAQSVISNTNNLTQLLSAKDFDIVIPDGNIITGIEVRFERKRGLSSTGAEINDNQVVLLGCSPSDDLGTLTWPTSDAYASYGGSTVLWNAGCTEANIESVNFGFGLRAQFIDNGCESSPCSTRAQVDHMQVKIYYDVPVTNEPIPYSILTMPVLPTAYASTTCVFTENTSTTTTAICDDANITTIDPSRNIFYGYLLFFITFAFCFVLWNKFRRKGGD